MNAPFSAPVWDAASSDDIIVVDEVSLHFAGGRRRFMAGPSPVVRAVEGVSFRVARGTCFAIVGESGSGKSSLARLVVGLRPPTVGEVTVDKVPLSSLDAAGLRQMRRKAQLVLQDPRASLDPRMTVFDTLSEALTVHGLYPARAERLDRIKTVLALVGLNLAHLGRYPHELSGGQRQRAAIARAIICEPEILVLDEPVSALDVSVQAQIINLLMELKERLALTFLMITHDLALVEHMADAVGVMYLGRFVEQGSVTNVCGAPRHPYTQSLMAAAAHGGSHLLDRGPTLLLAGSIPSPLAVPPGCSFHTRCPRARLIAAENPSVAVETPDGRVPRRCAEDEPAPDPAPNAASVATCHFAGEHSSTSLSHPTKR